MAGDTLDRKNRKVTYLVLIVLLFSTIPMVPSASADDGLPEQFQAQEIEAIFDPVSEETTITWRNIADSGGDFDLLEGLWNSTYHVYRSSEMITSENVGNLTPFYSVLACDKDEIGSNPGDCRGLPNKHPGHNTTFQVSAGVDGVFYYGIVTELGNGSLTTVFDVNASITGEPVHEVTTPVRSPFNVDATFNPATSQTKVQWINYNSINPVLDEEGPNSFDIHVWQTNEKIDRSNGATLFAQYSPIATLGPTETTYFVDVPPQTNREVYYSVTYLLKNWTQNGDDYEDVRFLSSNSLTTPVIEDNTPPPYVNSVGAIFTPNPNGTGFTTIAWDEVLSETGEQYRIYRHGEFFNSTNNPYAQLVGTVQEGVSQFTYFLPFNTYGDFVYCVVVVDRYGAYNENIPYNSCDYVDEDSSENWVKEPTNVNAEFLGNGVTRVTWTDQPGVEGERYHIWRSGYRVTGGEFVENSSLVWMGSASDGIEYFDVQLDDDIVGNNFFYFVTSEALYNCNGCTTPVMYTQLVQNYDGPITEDTRVPLPARINDAEMIGELKLVNLEWLNSINEVGETYSIYRHLGDPFSDSEFAISNYTDAGWEYVEGPISENSFSSIVSQFSVEDGIERDVWYAVIMSDEFGNTNPQIIPGIGGNAVLISEDTKAPSIEYSINDENNVPIQENSLVKGDYTLRIEVSETLDEFPIVNITTSTGGSLTGGSEQAMVLLASNNNDPTKGPEYFISFSISGNSIAGQLYISINLTDFSLNSIEHEILDYWIDAKAPTVSIFSPTDSGDGAKYLYGNDLKVIAGATDDVEIELMQMRFVQNYGEWNAVTEPWRDVYGVTVTEDGDWTIEMEFNSGNFLPGVHQVSVKAVDTAGNERITSIQFITDWCRHREDGETICEFTNPVQADPDVEFRDLNSTDPPYMIAYITAGVSLLAVITCLIVISTAMSAPKKKGDEELDEGDDWMSEFIGTSAEPDMAAITGTAPAEEKTEQKAMDDDDDDDDPFAVNVIQPKRRRKKSKKDDDDDDDDVEDEDVDWDEGGSPRKRAKRRASPKRKSAKRKVRRK